VKLNASEQARTLHVMRDDDVLILVERERFHDSRKGRNSWEESRVAITLTEARKLVAFINAINNTAASEA
jgi:hypothetical protein